jgi:hypothetical protein
MSWFMVLMFVLAGWWIEQRIESLQDRQDKLEERLAKRRPVRHSDVADVPESLGLWPSTPKK